MLNYKPKKAKKIMILLIATNKQIDRVLLTTNIGISPGLIFKLFITGEHFVKLFKNACTSVSN